MAGTLPSLGPQLNSARAKIRRANEHIRALKQSMKRFGKRDLYTVEADAYEPGFSFQQSRIVRTTVHTTATGIRLPRPVTHTQEFVKTMAFSIFLTPKSDYSAQYLRWSILVGEIVHSIGSALDNLIWELAQPLPAAQPPTASSTVRGRYNTALNQLGFPYTQERTKWGASCARYLYFLPDTATRAVLEKAQAFYAWETAGTDPETFPLEVVHKLWNRDKHRTVNLATTGLQFTVTTLRIPSLFPSANNLPSEVLKLFPRRPIEGKTEMATIRVQFPQEVEIGPDPIQLTVYVNPNFSLAILFGQGSPGERLDVLDTLESARNLAVQVINEFS